MNEQNIPIDINTTKLLEWLISRRHVSKDWQNDVLKVREKINGAIQDMPEHEGIVNLLSGQHINYFHCLKIIEILRETEADTKNLFGRYGSQRMKDWLDIVQLYQRDGVYLAEAAQMLIRNVNYELPSLRKQIAKLEQAQVEWEKKIKDCTKNEAVMLNDFNAVCKQLGIMGVKIKNELVELLKQLPEIYEKALGKIKMVENACEFYTTFIATHSDSMNESKIVPLLKYVLKNGNTTTYEFTYSKKPISIQAPSIQVENEIENNGTGIDFGDDIDFGDKEIDWENIGTDEGFEIVQNEDLAIESVSTENKQAEGSDTFTVLDNPNTRDQVLNDLIELESFLLMRRYEMSNESDLLSVTQMQDAPATLQMQTDESVTRMLTLVQDALGEFSNKRTQHLHNIKHSPKYIDMLTASLKQKLAVVERLKTSKEILAGKIRGARQEIVTIQPAIEIVITNTKILQGQIEDDISKKYKGRMTHIVGAVNMM